MSLLLVLLLFADSFDTALRAGLVALNANRLTEAQAELENASHLQPGDARVWLGLAETYRKMDQPQKAESAAAGVEALTKDPHLFRALALYYAQTGNALKTMDVVHRALKLSGLDAGLYFELTQLCLQREYYGTALDAATAGLKVYSKDAQLELARGVAFYGLRRFPEAIDAFLVTIQLDPGAEQPYLFLGRMLEQAEDRTPQIQAALATFAQNAPENYLSSYLFGKIMMAREPKRAEELLRQSIAVKDDVSDSHFELSIALEHQRRFEEAAQEMRRAIELQGNDSVAHYRLARLYERLNKPEEARAERELYHRLSAQR